MDAPLTNPAEGTHATRRTRRIALACIGVFGIAVVGTGLIVQHGQVPTNRLDLQEGGSLEFRGVSRGAQASATTIGVSTARDRDGHAWHHAISSPLTWHEHVHRLSPRFVQNHLPVSWRARSAVNLTQAQEKLLRFESRGAVILSSMQLTWEDSNGFESLGINSQLSAIHPHGIYTASLPPGRSPEVILRVRDRQESKPLRDWPLLGEVRMKNPAPVRPSTTSVDTLPVTRSVHGVALTLQSIVVDPAAAGADLTLLRIAMPHENSKNWSSDVAFYDERGGQVQISRKITSRHSKGITLKASGALWSDGPWHVRLKMRTSGSVSARVGAQAKFTAIPLPRQASSTGTSRTESAGSVPITLISLDSAHPSNEERMVIDFIRPLQSSDQRLKIVSAIDDLGRPYTLDGESRNLQGPAEIRSKFTLVGPKQAEPQAKTLDVTVEIEEPLVFDFFVLPEFKKRPPEAPKP
jgi:hypothetical protein